MQYTYIDEQAAGAYRLSCFDLAQVRQQRGGRALILGVQLVELTDQQVVGNPQRVRTHDRDSAGAVSRGLRVISITPLFGAQRCVHDAPRVSGQQRCSEAPDEAAHAPPLIAWGNFMRAHGAVPECIPPVRQGRCADQ